MAQIRAANSPVLTSASSRLNRSCRPDLISVSYAESPAFAPPRSDSGFPRRSRPRSSRFVRTDQRRSRRVCTGAAAAQSTGSALDSSCPAAVAHVVIKFVNLGIKVLFVKLELFSRFGVPHVTPWFVSPLGFTSFVSHSGFTRGSRIEPSLLCPMRTREVYMFHHR
ncbi:uncharacterized protein LOC120084796 [Benincasa hispida]|uniref:uncharacterized protein LOC120084796 n=1 Tax=Benincasa hispida TaxID=102211 RepID=UPI0019001D4C|nr:uncharacterized protein LOC120084796 [Benincasa hispida]